MTAIASATRNQRTAVLASGAGLVVMALPAAAAPYSAIDVPDLTTGNTSAVSTKVNTTGDDLEMLTLANVIEDTSYETQSSFAVDSAMAKRAAFTQAKIVADRTAAAQAAKDAQLSQVAAEAKVATERKATADAEAEAAAKAAAVEAEAAEQAKADKASAKTETKAETNTKTKTESKTVVEEVAAEVEEQAPAASSSGLISIARKYLGVPYVYGGTTPKGFDCSGLIQYAYKQLGISVPRTAAAQAAAGTRISKSSAREGDLVAFYNTSGHVYHIGIYLGDGRMLAAPKTGDVVKEQNVWGSNVFYVRM